MSTHTHTHTHAPTHPHTHTHPHIHTRTNVETSTKTADMTLTYRNLHVTKNNREKLVFIDLATNGPNFSVAGPVEGLFGAPLPSLKRLMMNFDPKTPLQGFGPKLFNKNLANVQNMQVCVPSVRATPHLPQLH